MYIEQAAPAAPSAALGRRLGRLALVVWAAAVYAVYWLGQLGLGTR